MKKHQLILPQAGAIALTGSQLPALGQIVPDNSLGAESSVVVPNHNIRGLQSDRIDGGAIRSGNLFHSFQEFKATGQASISPTPGAWKISSVALPAAIFLIFSALWESWAMPISFCSIPTASFSAPMPGYTQSGEDLRFFYF